MFLHGASLLVLLLYFRRYNQLTASVFGHSYQVQRHVVICLLLTTYHRTYCPLVRTPAITVAQRAFGRLFLLVASFFWSWPFFPPSGAGRYLWYGYGDRCFRGLAILPGVRGRSSYQRGLVGWIISTGIFRTLLATIPALTGPLIWKLKDMSLRPGIGWHSLYLYFGYLTLFCCKSRARTLPFTLTPFSGHSYLDHYLNEKEYFYRLIIHYCPLVWWLAQS